MVVNESLENLSSNYWEFLSESQPISASLRGDHRFDDQFDDMTRNAEDEMITALSGFASAAEAIDPASLGPDEQVTREVLMFEASTHADELRSRLAEFAVDPSMGAHIALLQLIPALPITEQAHADALIDRYARFDEAFDQMIGRLRQGIARQRMPSRTPVEKSIAQVDDYLASDIGGDPFVVGPGAPAVFDQPATEKWRAALSDVVSRVVRPAYAAYRAALVDEVLPKARPDERCGVRWIEDGEVVYERAIRRYTTLDLAPLDIHQIGLGEIAGLSAEYLRLGGSALGLHDLQEIFEHLRNDPALRFNDADEVSAAAQEAMDRARAAISEWFGRLPIADCVMAQIGGGAEEAPLGYYLPPATDGSRPGSYYINTSEPTTRTRYESEALAFHESIPGHHLQLAIAQELDGIAEFRKHANVTAYVEGWALYTERLADEMGLYTSDVTRLGMASFDSWRAGRLVVDSGMHALGWSRQEAIDYLTTNTPQAPNNIEAEVDRYIGWPGQALGYKLGQREIFRLRTAAQDRMGDRFDIKGFHDTVLDSGPVPLSTLERLVNDWATG